MMKDDASDKAKEYKEKIKMNSSDVNMNAPSDGAAVNIHGGTVVFGNDTSIINVSNGGDPCEEIQDQLRTRYINLYSSWTIPRINAKREFEYVTEDRSSFMVELTIVDEQSVGGSRRPTNELNHHLLQRRSSAELIEEGGIIDFLSKCNLLAGVAGVGKTSTIENLVLSWANKEMLLEFEYVFLFSCRNLNRYQNTPISTEQLFREEFNIDYSSLGNVDGKKVLVIIDGLDEIESLSSFLEGGNIGIYSLMYELIKEQSAIFPGHAVLLTGRPHIVSTLKRFQSLTGPIRIVQIFGFKTDAIQSYVYKFSNNDTALQQRILKKIFDSVSVKAMARIPQLLCSICSIYSWEANEPQLEKKSELFIWTLLSFLRHRFPQFVGMSPRDLLAHEVVREFILVISKLSHRLLKHNRNFFEEKELKELGTSDALMKSLLDTFVAKIETANGVCRYQFRHLIIHEFFAAIHYFVENTAMCHLIAKEFFEIAEFVSGFVHAYENKKNPVITFFVEKLWESAGKRKSSARQRLASMGRAKKRQTVSLVAEEIFEQWRRWKISCDTFCSLFYELFDERNSIPDCFVFDEQVEILLARLSSLQIVRLNHFLGCMLKPDLRKHGLSALRNVCICIEHTDFASSVESCRFLQLVTRSKDVRFERCSFRGRSIETLCEAVSKNRNFVLDGLSIRSCGLNDEQLLELTKCAAIIPRFSLVGETVPLNVMQSLCQKIYEDQASSRSRLRDLELRDCNLSDFSIAEITKVFHILDTVNLSGNRISSVRILQILEEIKFGKYHKEGKYKLQTLLLRNCSLSSEGLKSIEAAKRRVPKKYQIFVGL